MNKAKAIFSIIVLVELVVAIFLGGQIIKNRRVTVAKIDKNQVEVKSSQSLKYFYEPIADAVNNATYSWRKGEVVNTINKDGLHELSEYDAKKPYDTFRIIALGDSFTYGEFVSTEDNWTEVLEKRLNSLECGKKFEVINLGVYGYDVAYEVERYRTRGVKYDPDLIIWMLTDAHRVVEITTPWLEECQKENPFDPSSAPNYAVCGRRINNRLFAEYGKEFIQQYIAEKLDQIKNFYSGVIMAVNIDHTFEDIYLKSKEASKFKKLNIDYGNKAEYHLEDGHPNEKGHQYFATSIYNYMIDNKLISCDKIIQ